MIKKTLKKCGALLLCMMILLFSIGCTHQEELHELMITIGMGIDKDNVNPENVKLIAQIVNPDEIKSSSEGGSEISKGYFNTESSGENSFAAIREFTHILDSRLYLAHTVVFVIGNEAAKDGIGKYLDFFIRSIETRPLTKIVVAEGSAAKALDVQPSLDLMPARNIDNLIESQIYNSRSIKVTIKDYISTMVSKTASFTAPILRIEKIGDEDILVIKGIAVFKQDKMIGELDKYQSRGLLWIKGLVKSGVINVDVEQDSAAIEISKVSSDLTVEIRNKRPIVKIKIDVDGMLATQTGKKNLATISGIEELEKLFQEEIEKEIRTTIKKAQRINADIFGFGEEFHKHYKDEWKRMENQWEELFPTLQVDIEVNTKIVAAGNIIRPVYPEEETEEEMKK